MKLRHLPGIIPVLLALCACNKTAPVAAPAFPLSVDDAYQRLSRSDFADFVANRQCGVLIHIKSDPYPYDHMMKWHVTSSNREMLWFSVKLVAVDANHTKAKLEVSRDADGQEAYNNSKIYMRPAVNQPVRPAIKEQIRAILYDQPFDGRRAPAMDGMCDLQKRNLESGTASYNVNEDLSSIPNR